MKKNYLFGMLALAAMTMVGCSNDEVVNDYSQDNAIQFGTYVGRDASSRATVVTTETLGTEGFGVFAYYTGTADFDATKDVPNFMYNEKVSNNTWNNGKYTGPWTYAPVKYWPNNVGEKVSFFAYAPYQEEDEKNTDFALIENTAKGYPVIKYKVTAADGIIASANQKDLLYLVEPKVNLTKQKVDEKVEFLFGHALSRIAFAAQVMVDEVNSDNTGDTPDAKNHQYNYLADGTTITINSVKINGKFYESGELCLYRLAPANNQQFVSGWNSEEFVPFNNEVSYELKTANFESGENVFIGKDIVTGGSITENEDETKTWENPGLLNNTDSYLMIMPQEFTDDNKITVTVNYTVSTVDEDRDDEKNNSTIENKITSVPFNFIFKEGYAYKFMLHLGMTSVKLSATVTDWNNGGEWVVNVPINGDDTKSEWEDYNNPGQGGNTTAGE